MILCNRISTMTEGNADRHQMILGDDGEVIGQLGDVDVAKRAEAKLNDLIEARFAAKGGAYADAFRAVMDDPKNAALRQAYAGVTQDRFAQHAAAPDLDMTSLMAGREIDNCVKTYMYAHPGTAYPDAMDVVLAADPSLEATYANTNH